MNISRATEVELGSCNKSKSKLNGMNTLLLLNLKTKSYCLLIQDVTKLSEHWSGGACSMVSLLCAGTTKIDVEGDPPRSQTNILT